MKRNERTRQILIQGLKMPMKKRITKTKIITERSVRRDEEHYDRYDVNSLLSDMVVCSREYRIILGVIA